MSQVGTGNQVLGDRGQRIEPHREFIPEREGADLLSASALHGTWQQADSAQGLTSRAGRILFLWAGSSWLVSVCFYCSCTSTSITLKLLRMWSPMIFLDWPPEKGSRIICIYYNEAGVM